MNQQFDIFDDSRDVMLRNDVLHALAQRDGPAAAAAHRALRAEFPGDDRLPAMQVLIDTLGAGEPPRFTRYDEAQVAVAIVQGTVVPAARTVWPAEADARAWLSPVWAALARSAAALPFDASLPELHAAALWLQAGRAADALAAARTIESWRRVPQPLAWVAEATWRAEGLDVTWPLIAELSWLDPTRLGEVIGKVADPLMTRLQRAFDDRFDAGDDPGGLAWLPAWVLTDKPALAGVLSTAEPGQQSLPEQGFRLMLALLELERQGRHAAVIERRKRLLALHPGLFRAYMTSR
jgi:hypothetical protein